MFPAPFTIRPMILGHGLDLTDTDRIARMLEEHGERFLSRCFTAGERAYCDTHTARRAEVYAARFAAKEAVLKALGTGLSGGIQWTDVEVTREASGKPGVKLSGKAAEIAVSSGISAIALSLTHVRGFAAASAIAWGEGGAK